jgi:hypothetical protein
LEARDQHQPNLEMGETGINDVTKEWLFDSLKAKQILCYTWMPLQEAIQETLRFIENSAR